MLNKIKYIRKISNIPNSCVEKYLDLKGKKAHKTLDEANLWEKLYTLATPDILVSTRIDSEFRIRKEYWLAFFDALQVKKLKTVENGK